MAYFAPPPAYYRLYHPHPHTQDSPHTQKPIKWAPLPPPRPVWNEIIVVFGQPREFSQKYLPPNPEAVIRTDVIQQQREESPPLESDSIKEELKKLNKSLLVSFLQLLDFLLHQPGRLKEKIFDLECLSSNMHFLLNAYRPYQARHELLLLLEKQKSRRAQMTEDLNVAVKETRDTLASLVNIIDAEMCNSTPTDSLSLSTNHHSSILKDDPETTPSCNTELSQPEIDFQRSIDEQLSQHFQQNLLSHNLGSSSSSFASSTEPDDQNIATKTPSKRSRR